MTLPTDDELAAMLADATKGPWRTIGSIPQDGWEGWTICAQPSPILRGFTLAIAEVCGPQDKPEKQANAALIALATDLAAEVLRLRAERTVNVAEAARGPDRNATISLALKADSGYRADETARVSAEQWGRILAIIYEPSALAGYPK
jgi:hypothetical protein